MARDAQKSTQHFQRKMKRNAYVPTVLYRATTAKRGDIVPPDGVLIFDTDLNQLFVGDGTTTGGLSVGGVKEEVRSITAAAASTATVEGVFVTSTAQAVTTNIFTATAHGLKVGDTVTCMSSDGTLANVGLVANTQYTVATVDDANSFTLTGVTAANDTQSISFRADTKTVTSTAQTASTNTFTAANHGLVVGNKVTLTSQSSTGAFDLTMGTVYTVATTADVNSFTLTGVAFSSNGTETIVFSYLGSRHNDYITWANGATLRTGDGITIGGTAPIKDADGTQVSGEVYMIKEDTEVNGGNERNATTRFKIASNRANALAGTNLTMRNLGSSVTFAATDVYLMGYEDVTVVTPAVACDIYLPDATAVDYGRFTVKKTNAAYDVTVKSVAGTLDGTAAATGVTLPTSQYASLTAVSDGTNYHLTDKETYVGATSWTLGATDSMAIDADTTDHTGAYILNINTGINSASVDSLRVNVDVGTALSGAEIAKGVYVDANGIAADADTSGILAYDALMTATSTDRADLTGYKIAFDGTMDTADTITGVLVDGASLTVNASAASVHGVEISFASLTETDFATGECNAVDITMPATYQGTDTESAIKATGAGAEVDILSGAATVYGINETLGAATVALNIDADTTDHTAGNVINVDVGVNSATVNALNIDVDVGTALSAGEIAKAIDIDMNGKAADANTSGLVGVDVTMTDASTAAADYIGYRVILDGTHDGGDTCYGVMVDANNTLNNAGEVFYGVLIDTVGVTNTSSAAANALQINVGTGTKAIVIDADTEDTASANIIDIDVGVNSASCSAINLDTEVQTALSGAEAVKGLDINQVAKAADADTSSITGVEITQKTVSTARSDLYGVKVDYAGSSALDQGDTITGILVDGTNLTVNNTSATYHGIEIALASLTETDYATGEFNALDITMPATYQGTDVASAIKIAGGGSQVDILSGAATLYGVDITSGAALVPINIDSDTTDTTAAATILADIGVNSASHSFISAAIDIGTALSGAEIVKGAFFDMNCTGGQADANTSGLIGVDVALTGVTGSAADATGYKVLLDGTHDQSDVSIGLLVDVDATLNNAGEICYGVHVDTSGATNTSSAAFDAVKMTLGASTVGINIDAGTADHTGANIIVADVDVNSASCNFISADIDVGTALSAAETVNGILIDIDGHASDASNSVINGISLTSANTSGGYCTAINIDGTWDNCIDAQGWNTLGYVSLEKYYRCEDFDDEVAGVNIDGGLRADEWTVAGTNGSADDVVYSNLTGGAIVCTTDGADDDSINLTWDSIYVDVDSNPVIEFRYKIDKVSGAAANLSSAMVGLVETGGFVDKANIEATTDDFILVGTDGDNGHGFGAASIMVLTDDNGGAAQTGLREDTGVDASADTYITVRIDCTDTEQPRVWVNNTGGAITPANEIAAASITGTIQAGIKMHPQIHVQALDGNPYIMTVDYIKVWQDRG